MSLGSCALTTVMKVTGTGSLQVSSTLASTHGVQRWAAGVILVLGAAATCRVRLDTGTGVLEGREVLQSPSGGWGIKIRAEEGEEGWLPAASGCWCTCSPHGSGLCFGAAPCQERHRGAPGTSFCSRFPTDFIAAFLPLAQKQSGSWCLLRLPKHLPTWSKSHELRGCV